MSSARSTSSATTPSTTRASTSGRRPAIRTGSGALLRGARRPPARASSTSSPTPIWSRSGARARPLPERDPRSFYEPAVEAIAESGVAVEVSTAGLRKPVGELYPSQAFAEMCVEAGAAFALSSDAHLPEQVGYGYDRRARVPRRARGRGDLRLRAPPSVGWSRWGCARHRHERRDRLRQPPLRRRAAR